MTSRSVRRRALNSVCISLLLILFAACFDDDSSPPVSEPADQPQQQAAPADQSQAAPSDPDEPARQEAQVQQAPSETHAQQQTQPAVTDEQQAQQTQPVLQQAQQAQHTEPVQQQAQQAAPTAAVLLPGTRIVSVFGDLTEILYALGAGHVLVGRDASSIYPPEAETLPNLGFTQALAAEGVLALEPTLLIGNQTAGPPEVLDQIRGAGVEVLIIQSPSTFEAPAIKIRAVGAALGLEERAEALARDVEARIAAFRAEVDVQTADGGRPSVLFIYVRRNGLQLVAGEGSAAAAMIEAAGGADAGSAAGVIGFATLTPEAVVAADPEIILVMERGLDSVGGVEGMLEIPGVAQTRAGQEHRFIAMDDLYLLGFGPRLPEALRDLASEIVRVKEE